jgi:hypothetical protein
MAQIPNSGQAVVDLPKIEDYCLNPLHPRGRHKARVLQQALGLQRNDAGWLRDALLSGIRSSDATDIRTNRYGHLWRADIPVTRHERNAVIRTLWIVRTDEDFPRFVTCWVL